MLSKIDRYCLEKLRDYKGGTLAELDTDEQEKFWGKLANRGFAKMHDHAIVGIERVPGRYVSLTEAGREALAADNSN